jgi:hypothetical protein
MASGWGCQYQTVSDEREDWCRLLNHKCEPGCKGCVLYGNGLFSVTTTPSNSAFERRKRKNRSDNPLGER